MTTTTCTHCGTERVFSDSKKTVICPNCDRPNISDFSFEQTLDVLKKNVAEIRALLRDPFPKHPDALFNALATGIKAQAKAIRGEDIGPVETYHDCKYGCGRQVKDGNVCDVCREICSNDF